MRYMMLIYSNEMRDLPERNYEPHQRTVEEATRAGVFVAAEPLAPPSSTTTLQIQNGQTLITDGPLPNRRNNWPATTSSIARTWTMRSSGPRRFIPPALPRYRSSPSHAWHAEVSPKAAAVARKN